MDELIKLWVLFLDRDGVISYQCGQAGQLGWFAYTRDFFVNAFGILDIFTPILLVTNKAVIGKGHCISSQQQKIIIKINLDLLRHNSYLLDYFYCPHELDAYLTDFLLLCECCEPNPRLLVQAFEEYDVNYFELVFICYKSSDISAAQSEAMELSLHFAAIYASKIGAAMKKPKCCFDRRGMIV